MIEAWSTASIQNHMNVRSRSTIPKLTPCEPLRVGSGCVSGTRARTTSENSALVAASPMNSARYENVATTPAATGAIENPRLIAQYKKPYARWRCSGGTTSAMNAGTAGRYRPPTKPSANTDTHSIGSELDALTHNFMHAPPNSEPTIVTLRPRRSVSTPPTSDAITVPAPNSEMIAPASPSERPRCRVR